MALLLHYISYLYIVTVLYRLTVFTVLFAFNSFCGEFMNDL